LERNLAKNWQIFSKFSEIINFEQKIELQKNAAFWENPENIWSKFSKIQQHSDKFCKKIIKSVKFSAISNEKIELRERFIFVYFFTQTDPTRTVQRTRFFSPHGFPGFWDSIPNGAKECIV
jgi:hypothetical protein